MARVRVREAQGESEGPTWNTKDSVFWKVDLSLRLSRCSLYSMMVFSSIPIRCFTFSLDTPHGGKEGGGKAHQLDATGMKVPQE